MRSCSARVAGIRSSRRAALEEAAVAGAAARGDFGLVMLGQAGCCCEPLARGPVESKNAAVALHAMHRPRKKVAASVDAKPRKNVRFLR